ncbi:MmgE/PrpD family protein [Pusillimonas sp. MFBS29]|nr:MmgE/PrpD family protein [Pusillimonas sp. MFBS29]MCC2595874.1 MmgE/PrpD family protein [Pusillimonas sp. MFBS29]
MIGAESRLCAYIASLPQRDFVDATRHRVSQALLDWFTAGCSGSSLAAASTLQQLALQLIPAEGAAPIFGGGAAHPLATALCNAGIAHLCEIDDAHRTAMLHPGIVAISPAMALSTTTPLSNQRFTAAIVAGYEVAIRAGEALGGEHSGRFHATATAGTLGAAAASATVLGLDADQIHHALGIAATQATGLWQFVDDGAHEAKALHPAFAVRNGIAAAYAAKLGYPGARDFMSGSRGMHALLHGNGDLSCLDKDLGVTDRISSTTIKPWPTCGQLFTAIGAAQAIIDEHDLDPQFIESVNVSIFPQALRIAKVDWPSKPAETCFSGRYCLAVLLTNGRLALDDMERPKLDNPDLLALAARITIAPEPGYASAFPDRRPATVTITLKNGKVLSAMRDKRQGDPEAPFNWEQLDARLRDFNPGMPETRASAIAGWCEALQHSPANARFSNPEKDLFGTA